MNKCKKCSKIARLERKLEEADLILYTVVRNSAILPLGKKLGKNEQQISEKTLETMAEIKKAVNLKAARRSMALGLADKNGANTDEHSGGMDA